MTRRTAALGLLAATQLVCNQAILNAPDGSIISVTVNPPFIPAHGGSAVVSAVVIEPAGTPVPDGTVVQFFTTLGRIDEQGKTNDGVARVNLISDARSGTATVTALSGTASADAEVTIGSALPDRVDIQAFPTRLRDQRTARLVANVFDENGNPVANVPVIFEASANATHESLESRGQPVFTDNTGQAVDFLTTVYPPMSPPRFITVRATTSNGVSDDVQITIN